MMQSLLNHTRRPDITFHRSGRIDITAAVVTALGIKPGDVIDITTEGREYYLHVRHRATELVGRHQLQCQPTNPRSRNMRTHSVQLCSIILQLTGSNQQAHVMAGQPVSHPDLHATVLPLIIPKQ